MSSKVSKMKGLLPRGFKADKCKASLRMAVARMKLMRNKRDAQVKQVRREVAQLLQSGDDTTARIRVDHVIRDEKTIQAYELLEVYSELIIQRLHIIDSQKICPVDLKEAVATLVFAAPRCADVPELSDVMKHFHAKYGKEFISSALELRPGSGVSQLVIDKLSASSANIETKVKALKSIAEENNVNWEAKGFEEEKQVPELVRLVQIISAATQQSVLSQTSWVRREMRPIILDGSSKFLKASEMGTVQHAPAQTPPAATTYEPQTYTRQNSGAYQPARPNNSSVISDPSHATPAQAYRSQSSSRNNVKNIAESKHVNVEETPPDLSDHDEEYTTVEEAAEAAAKSAAIASKAARAAATMARHGGLSREQSNASSKSYSSRDSPRKYDLEELNSKPETPSSFSVQTNTTHARGPQIGQFKPTPERSSIAPPSPSPSHSSASSDGYDEQYEVNSNITSHISPGYSKQKTAVQKDEEYGDTGINTRYTNSNRQASAGFQEDAIWGANGDEEQPEVVSFDIRYDSFGVFNGSTLEKYDKPAYDEESFFRFERNDSSASKQGTAWFSSDNSSSPKQFKSNSTSKNSSLLPYTSNSSQRDPVHSPTYVGSVTKFDKGLKSTKSSNLFNDDDSNLLSVLSGQSPPQFHAEEDSGPKFDSGPNFDSDMLSDDDNGDANPVHVHVEEEKVIEKEYTTGPSLSPLSHAKDNSKEAFTLSSDKSHTIRSPQSLRTRDLRTNRREPVHPKIMNEPGVKTEKMPLRYIPKESSSDDDDYSGPREFLKFDELKGGRRNNPGSTQLPYKVKPLAEEPKPSVQPVIRKHKVDLLVDEERLYTPNHLKSRESEVRRNSPLRDATLGNKLNERTEAPGRSALTYTPNIRNFDEEEETEKEIVAQPPKIKLNVLSSSMISDYVALEGEGAEEVVVKQTKTKLKGPSSSRVSKGYLGANENQLDNQEGLKNSRRVVGNSRRDSLEVQMEAPMEKSNEAPCKTSESRRHPQYVPAREDSDEEEHVRTVQPMERTKHSPVDTRKEKVELKEKKEEMASAQPVFPRASFPLDMDALRARVQQIKASMNNP